MEQGQSRASGLLSGWPKGGLNLAGYPPPMHAAAI